MLTIYLLVGAICALVDVITFIAMHLLHQNNTWTKHSNDILWTVGHCVALMFIWPISLIVGIVHAIVISKTED